MSKLSEELRLFLDKKKWSPDDLAKEVGIHRAQIFRWLADDTKPSKMALKLLAMVGFNPKETK